MNTMFDSLTSEERLQQYYDELLSQKDTLFELRAFQLHNNRANARQILKQDENRFSRLVSDTLKRLNALKRPS